MNIEKVAVIGAGLMGSGIAAHVANAGIPVTLLYIAPKEAPNRNVIAENAVNNMLKPVKMGSPTPLMHKKNAKLITTGNLEDDLKLIEDADLIGYTKARSEGFTAKKNDVLVAKPPKRMKNNGFLEPR